MELQFKQSRPVPVTGLAFPQGEVNNFVVASEDGNVYTGTLQLGRALSSGPRAGLVAGISYDVERALSGVFFHWEIRYVGASHPTYCN